MVSSPSEEYSDKNCVCDLKIYNICEELRLLFTKNYMEYMELLILILCCWRILPFMTIKKEKNKYISVLSFPLWTSWQKLLLTWIYLTAVVMTIHVRTMANTIAQKSSFANQATITREINSEPANSVGSVFDS